MRRKRSGRWTVAVGWLRSFVCALLIASTLGSVGHVLSSWLCRSGDDPERLFGQSSWSPVPHEISHDDIMGTIAEALKARRRRGSSKGAPGFVFCGARLRGGSADHPSAKSKKVILSDTVYVRGLPRFANEEWVAVLIGRSCVKVDAATGARQAREHFRSVQRARVDTGRMGRCSCTGTSGECRQDPRSWASRAWRKRCVWSGR
jgi:hypothetical protein